MMNKKLILISALLFSFNGWAQVIDAEINELISSAETDYFNLPFFNEEHEYNLTPKKDPFETEEQYKLRLREFSPEEKELILFGLSEEISSDDYNAEKERWEINIKKNIGSFSKNFSLTSYPGENVFGVKKQIIKYRGTTGEFFLLNVKDDMEIYLPMERNLAKSLHPKLRFHYLILVDANKKSYDLNRNVYTPTLQNPRDIDNWEYTVNGFLKAIAVKTNETNDVLVSQMFPVPSKYEREMNDLRSEVCTLDVNYSSYISSEDKEYDKKLAASMSRRISRKLNKVNQMIAKQEYDEARVEINALLSNNIGKLSAYEEAFTYYHLMIIEQLKGNSEAAMNLAKQLLLANDNYDHARDIYYDKDVMLTSDRALTTTALEAVASFLIGGYLKKRDFGGIVNLARKAKKDRDPYAVGIKNALSNYCDDYGGFNMSEKQSLLQLEKPVAANYPARAINRMLSGECIVEYTVDKNGKTKDIRAIKCSDNIFKKASIQAVSESKYKPLIIDGIEEEVPNLIHKVSFEIRGE